MIFDSLTNTQRWIVAFVVSVCFVIVVSPMVLKTLSKIGDNMGIKLTNSQGCSSWIGIAAQVLVFFLLVRLTIHIFSRMMRNEKGDEKGKESYDDEESIKNKQDLQARMQEILNKEYPPFNGLVSPADMLRCNGAQLIAENHQSPECVKAARSCLSDPFSEDCKNNLNNCVYVSKNEALSKLVMDNCGFAYRPNP